MSLAAVSFPTHWYYTIDLIYGIGLWIGVPPGTNTGGGCGPQVSSLYLSLFATRSHAPEWQTKVTT